MALILCQFRGFRPPNLPEQLLFLMQISLQYHGHFIDQVQTGCAHNVASLALRRVVKRFLQALPRGVGVQRQQHDGCHKGVEDKTQLWQLGKLLAGSAVMQSKTKRLIGHGRQ